MFSRVFVAALIALPMIASAAPTDAPGSSHCNVGQVSCCNQVLQNSGSTSAAAGGLLGIPLNVFPFVGLDCNPISVLGLGTNSCAAQPVCCENTSFNGVLNLFNCAPINVSV